MNRGSLPFDRRVDPQQLTQRLADALIAAHAKDVVVTDRRVRFSGGLFRKTSNRNVLLPITQGELIVNADAGRIDYRVSYRQMAIVLGVLSVIAIPLMAAARFSIPMMPIVIALMWLSVGGAIVWVGRFRFRRLLRDAIGVVSPT